VLRPLLWKELRQIRRSRAALMSATVLPVLLMVVTPGVQYWSLTSTSASAALRAQPAGSLGDDPKEVFISLLLPMFVALAGLVTPAVMATYTVVGERERRSLDLLMALPVRPSHILGAKLLAVLIFAAGILLPMFLFDVVVLLSLHAIDVGYAALLLLLLLCTLAYAVAEALLLALLARDLRTAQNLNGALLVPAVSVTFAVLFGAPEGLRLPLLMVLYAALAAAMILLGMRWLTFERYAA
jgi:ABC-2 type transport system permease protein